MRSFLAKKGIWRDPGPAWTPQAQGLVERVNGTIKRLLGKVLRELKLPAAVWPGLLAGVVQQLNGLVHSALGESPYKKAGDARAEEMPELAVSDVVSVMDRRNGQALEGCFGGVLREQVVSVVARSPSGGWRVLRVHPADIKLISRQGLAEPGRGGDVLRVKRGVGGGDEVSSSIDADEYNLIDAEEYVEAGDSGADVEDEDMVCPQQAGAPAQENEQVLGQNSVVVVKENDDKKWLAQVIKAGKSTIQGARLTKEEGGKWTPMELVDFKRKDVVRAYPMSGGEVPPVAEAALHGEGALEVEVPKDAPVPAEEERQESVEPVVLVDFSDGEEEVQEAVALAARIPTLPENRAKNQVEATKEEVAAGSHKIADLKELNSYAEMGVLGPKVTKVTPHVLSRTFTAGWRRTWKGEGDERVAKSRLYARGFEDRRDRGWLETYSGTMDAGLMKTAMVYALSRGWRAAKVDVRTAFLQTKSRDELYLKLPRDLPEGADELGFEPNGIYPQLKIVYGRTDGTRMYTVNFKQAAKKEEWNEVVESILVQKGASGEPEGLLLMHVDDKFCFAEDPVAKLEKIGKHYKLGPITLLERDKPITYCGLEIAWDAVTRTCKHARRRARARSARTSRWKP